MLMQLPPESFSLMEAGVAFAPDCTTDNLCNSFYHSLPLLTGHATTPDNVLRCPSLSAHRIPLPNPVPFLTDLTASSLTTERLSSYHIH